MKISFLTILIVVLSGLAICTVAILYYFSVMDPSVFWKVEPVAVPLQVAKNKEPMQAKPATKIINFTVPAEINQKDELGSCFAQSVAQPYRGDAFRCMIDSQIYDPCFSVTDKDFVFCQVDPLSQEAVLIKFSKALPKNAISKEVRENWGWFLKLDDGTVCSPYTGTRPVIDGQTAVYGCKTNDKNKLVVIIGDLEVGDPWVANKEALLKNGVKWTKEFMGKVPIDTVWK